MNQVQWDTAHLATATGRTEADKCHRKVNILNSSDQEGHSPRKDNTAPARLNPSSQHWLQLSLLQIKPPWQSLFQGD